MKIFAIFSLLYDEKPLFACDNCNAESLADGGHKTSYRPFDKVRDRFEIGELESDYKQLFRHKIRCILLKYLYIYMIVLAKIIRRYLFSIAQSRTNGVHLRYEKK